MLREFVVSLRRNLGLALLSLVLSTTLWVFVSNEVNPARVDVFPNPIPVQIKNLPPGMDVYSTIDPVKIRISAPQEVWNRLRSDSFTASVDLSKGGTGVQGYPITVQRPDPQITIQEIIPDKATIRMEVTKQKTVPVEVNILGAVPFGWVYKHPQPSASEVKVTGPEEAVNQVERAVADVNLEGATLSINQLFPLVPTNSRGGRVDDVRIDPANVEIEIPIEQQVHSSTVPVNPTVTGSVAAGYWLSGITVDPATVILVGDRDVLQTVTYVRTAIVDVSGATQDVSQLVELNLPSGVGLASGQKVTVRVSVSPVNSTKTFAVAPTLKGLADGRLGSANPVNITLSGPISALRDVAPTDIQVILDVTGLDVGTHVLAPQVMVPTRTELVSVSPERIGVVIQSVAQPSPTPTPASTPTGRGPGS